jgi:flagellar hook protein FlgE
MIGALWTGISGLAAQQTALDNEAHNIANVNTVGYKSSRISFADQMYQDKIGKGSKIMDAEKIYTQGNLKVTGVNYDLALSGNGFFAMAEANATGSAEIFYTRAGNFRMGDNGNFQDAAGNSVQGWAMRDIDTATDVKSTNPNVTYYNSDYTKLVTSKVIKHSNYIETVSAKTTDYTLTAKADNSTIYTGSSLKSQANKISDVEELIKNYSSMVQNLSENPDGPSATSTAQVTYIDFPDMGAAMTKEGDEAYIYLDSVKYATSWDTDYYTTMKKLADEISKIPGFKATMANNATATAATAGAAGVPEVTAVAAWAESTNDLAVAKGVLKIESMVPGKAFTISELAQVSGTTVTQGSVIDVNTAGTKVVVGSGKGAVESARDALALGVVGKQTDVYTVADDLGTLGNASNVTYSKDFTYSAVVYDNATKANVTISAITLTDITSVDDMAAQLNADSNFDDHLIAVNVNDTLVIKTLDSNSDVEFAGTLTSDVSATALASGVAAGSALTFSAEPKSYPDGVRSFTFAATTIAQTGATNPTTAFTITAPADMDALVAALNANTSFAAGPLVATNSGGNLVITDNSGGGAMTAIAPLQVVANTAIEKNTTSSGREGAGAELLEMVTAIDQTASRGNLQLRLDTLGISDSAFGEFSVDTTGLITMKQDGADFAIGQIAVATFNNNRGLNPAGNNLLQKTNESGDAIYNLNNAKAATIEGGTLELSEADLSESLVNLMVFQRAFEANAKSITSADELLNTLINLKR